MPEEVNMREIKAAVNTLAKLGYVYCGGDEWIPPPEDDGESAEPSEEDKAVHAKLEKAEEELELLRTAVKDAEESLNDLRDDVERQINAIIYELQ